MISTILITLCMISGNIQTNKEAVAKAVELLRQNMVQPNQTVLTDLTSPFLSYGHSNGVIENKDEFIASLVSGKYNFLSIDLTNQKIEVEEDVAIVRHDLDAKTHDMGKPENTVRLHILTVWQKKGDKWILIARQAVKR